MLEVLQKYEVLRSGKLGIHTDMPFTVETTGPLPRHRPYHATHVERKIIEEEVKRMEALGVLEKGPVDSCCPILLTGKPDGSVRPLTDFRTLNKVVKKETFPLPLIPDLHHATAGSKWFCSLDLAKGYWQVPIAPADQAKVGLVCHLGTYRYLKMPFGISTAPSAFQRLMHSLLADLLGSQCIVYLDDVLIMGSDFDQLCTNLDLVLSRLKAANWKLSVKKSTFGTQACDYLGFQVSGSGLTIDEQRAERLLTTPPPRDRPGLRRLYGMLSYYRHLIPRFSMITAPLTPMMSPKTPFEWTADADHAYRTCLKILSSKPALRHFSFNDPADLWVDASDTGIGFVLEQGQGPVLFGSRQLRGAELNYAVMEKEALGALYALNKTRYWTEANPKVTLKTDHSNLRFLRTANLSGRMARWAVAFSTFLGSVDYVKGRTNLAADYLSRALDNTPLPRIDRATLLADPANFVSAVSTRSRATRSALGEEGQEGRRVQEEGTTSDSDLTRVVIAQDSEELKYEEFVKRVKKGTTPKKAQVLLKRRSYPTTREQGLTYVQLSGPDREVLLCPPQEAKEVATHVHRDLGHPGSTALYKTVTSLIYSPGLQDVCEALVSECELCKKVKHGRSRFGAQVTNLSGTAPNSTVYLDHVGPLPPNGHPDGEDDGERFILGIVDSATKLVSYNACMGTTADEASTIVRRHWIQNFGPPSVIVADNGPAFRGQAFQDMCKTHNIRLVFTTTYNPQGNVSERYHATIMARLRAKLSEKKYDLSGEAPVPWSEALDEVVYEYNHSPRRGLGLSPYTLWTGRPSRALLSGLPRRDQAFPDVPLSVLDDIRRADALRYQAKRLHGDTRTPLVLEPGLRVYLRPVIKSGSKLSPKNVGPYVIEEVRGPATFLCREEKQDGELTQATTREIVGWLPPRVLKSSSDPHASDVAASGT